MRNLYNNLSVKFDMFVDISNILLAHPLIQCKGRSAPLSENFEKSDITPLLCIIRI